MLKHLRNKRENLIFRNIRSKKELWNKERRNPNKVVKNLWTIRINLLLYSIILNFRLNKCKSRSKLYILEIPLKGEVEEEEEEEKVRIEVEAFLEEAEVEEETEEEEEAEVEVEDV